MNIKLQLPKLMHLRPRITVVGVGGAGSNAVNNMITSGLSGVNFVVANTDAQSLANSAAENRIQLGATLTEGLGAGAKPEIGRASAEEAIEEIRTQVAGSHMVFVAAGMGGGTGTGAAAVIARIARECGALTVGVVTKPFHFEGTRRMRAAEAGIAALRPEVDTLIVIPNQNLFRIANERTTFAEAFVLADQVLYSGIACVVDLIVKEGLINLDFADVRTIMSGMGTAMMGTGEATGERRAVMAAEEAICNPLLDDISLRGAKGLLVSITGSHDLKLYEVDEAAQRVRQEVDPEANIIVGATFDDSMGDRLRVSIVASGMERMGELSSLRPLAGETGAAMPAAAAQPASMPDTQPPFIEPYPEPYAPAPQLSPAGPPPMPAQMMPPTAPAMMNDAPPAAAQAPAPLPAWAPASSPADFARTISEALDGHLDGTPPPRHAQHAHPGAWASQSGGVFEDAPPQIAPAPDVLSTLGQHAPPARDAVQGTVFYPQPPAVPHPPARRMPAVEDFPLPGQRELQAKAQAYARQAAPTPAPPPAARPHAQPAGAGQEPARKLGFFQRLLGRRRQSSREAGAATGSNPQAKDGVYPHHEGAGTAARQRPATGARSASKQDNEAYELPEFFGTGRR